jgi:methyl-accepting chemotaxis protein
MENKMNFSNLKIANRLLIGFGAILLLLTVAVGVAISQLSSLNNDVQVLANDRVPKMNTANAWIVRVLDTARHTRNMLIMTDPDQIKKEIDAVAEDKKIRMEYMDQLKKTTTLPEAKTLLQAVIDARAIYAPLEDEYLKLIASGDMATAKAMLLEKMRPAQLSYIDSLQKLVDFEIQVATQDGNIAGDQYRSSRNLMIGLEIFALILGAALATYITRGLLNQLGGEPSEAAHVASKIADGDLTATVTVRTGDETSMMHAIKRMRDNLTNIVSDVRSGTETIATASAQIAAGNMDLSSRTEQQAASLEETASSMEELTSTVKQNADNSLQANQLAVSASNVAIRGGAVVAQVVDTMSAINDSAKKIVDIISVIDGIAFQTNILALNAAVEAARAGEQGRGFAVVAAEVRNLAQRSASAAKEIKTLIGDSVEKVDAGSKLVNEAGATMEEVVTSVKRVSDIISEITAASQEQTAGIEQINQAIAQMDEVTQQNAALVEEAAAAAGSLQEQAGQLVETVNVFKLDSAQTMSITPSKTRARQAHASDTRVTAISSAKNAKRPIVPLTQVKRVANSTMSGEWEAF